MVTQRVSSGSGTCVSLPCRHPEEIETASCDYASRLVTGAPVATSWAMVVSNLVINIRNGHRLSIDDPGWLMSTQPERS